MHRPIAVETVRLDLFGTLVCQLYALRWTRIRMNLVILVLPKTYAEGTRGGIHVKDELMSRASIIMRIAFVEILRFLVMIVERHAGFLILYMLAALEQIHAS